MKAVSWEFAFLKLKEWREHKWLVSFGKVVLEESQDETRTMFLGSSGSRVEDVDNAAGTVTLLGEGIKSLMGARFRFSASDDLPFKEADLDPWEYAEVLEATFPDGEILVFAREWELKS
jgi:hypothetical protein